MRVRQAQYLHVNTKDLPRRCLWLKRNALGIAYCNQVQGGASFWLGGAELRSGSGLGLDIGPG